MKIAMWSGPRNLSTAMMYSFGNRPDFHVWDEPFYGAYLATTGLDHPMRAEVIAAGSTDPQEVADQIVARGDGVFLKLMGFHMLDDFPLDWAEDFTHVHLLRHPARVIASYSAKREEPTRADIGFDAQLSLFRKFPGPVISSFDIRGNPEAALTQLCASIGLASDPSMLSWPKGPKSFDGVWAPHWYDAVHKSSRFASAEGTLPELDGAQSALLEEVLPIYQEMANSKLNIDM
ncbi:MAG: HAD family hydrolase [Pseudomonadota bacterium]